jgi:hypothetical protein
MIPAELTRAYEQGRARSALLASAPVLVLPLAARTVGLAAPVAVIVALLGTVAIAHWRGRSWGRGAAIGVAAGMLIAAPAIAMTIAGYGCVGGICDGRCATICGSAGVLGGALLGAKAGDWRALFAGAVVAGLAGAVGCWPMGIAVVTSMAASMVAAAGAGRAARALLA